MRHGSTLVLAALLLAPALAAAGPVEVGARQEVALTPTPRPAILIEGDGDLTALNGVRGGSGTPADPYVIRGWLLLHDRLSALALRGTRAHVLIEDVHVPLQTAHTGYRSCLPDPTLCPQFIGIELFDAQNVTVRASTVTYAQAGVRVHGGSSDVLLEGVSVGQAGRAELPGDWGFVVRDASRVTLRGVQAENVLSGFHVQDASDVTVERSRFDGARIATRGVTLATPLDGVTLRENRFDGVKVFADGELRDVTLLRNEFNGSGAGFGNNAFGSYRGALFCGNVFTGGSGAITGGNAWDVRIVGNRLVGNARGIEIGPAVNATLERNLVTGHSGAGVWLHGTGLVLRNNSVHGNLRTFLPSNGTDARDNWWGDASGPSGIGPGTGERLATLAGATVHFSPWLAAEPDLTDPCRGPAQPLGPPAPGPVGVRWEAEARVKVTLPGGVSMEASHTQDGDVDLRPLLP